MTHATNIGQMHARKNGKTMTGKSQEHEDAYRLQLESEQRYAIGKLPELNERYGLTTNMGYGTQAHINGLRKYGKSKYHRKSFIKKYCYLG